MQKSKLLVESETYAERTLKAYHLAEDYKSLIIHISINDGHRFDGS